MCLLSVLCASAGPIYRGVAQAPVARISSTSGMLNSSANYMSSSMQVRGIQTSASFVCGGVTSGSTYARMNSPIRRGPSGPSGPPGDPWWSCNCVDEDGDAICDICGCALNIIPEGGVCDCEDHCWCPLTFDWKAILFLSALAGAYAVHKVRTGKKKVQA